MSSGRSKGQSVNYQRFTPSGCKYKGIRKVKIGASIKFLLIPTELK